VTDNSSAGTVQTIPVEGITVPFPVTISPSAGALPFVFAGAAYSLMFTASGGAGNVTVRLPACRRLTFLTGQTVGTLSGIPTLAGNYTISVTASDPFGDSATQQYTLQVLSLFVPVTVSETVHANDGPGLMAGPLPLTVTDVETIHVVDSPSFALEFVFITDLETIHVNDAPSLLLEFVPVTVAETVHVIDSPKLTGGACDINNGGAITVVDAQDIVKQALGVSPAANDLNGDGTLNVVDVEIVISAALGLGCSAQ